MDNHNSISLGASFRLSPLSCVYPHFLTPWASQLGRNREIGDQTEKRCSPPKFAIGKLLKWKWDLELLAITWDCVSSWVSSPGWKRVSSRVKRIALDFTQLAEEKEWKRYLNSVWGEKRPDNFLWNCLLSTPSLHRQNQWQSSPDLMFYLSFQH